MDQNSKILELDRIPKNRYQTIDGRKVFSPEDFEEFVKLQKMLLKGTKKTNYTIQIRVQDDGFDVVATDMMVEPDVVMNVYKEKMDRGKDIVKLVQKNADPSCNQTIFLPENLKLDSERDCAPEVINGFLYAKDSHEVTTVIEIQKRLSKSNLALHGEVFEKIDSVSNPFIVNESIHKNQSIHITLQKIDYSGDYIQLWGSLFENGAMSKPVKIAISELLRGSKMILSLLKHLEFSIKERKSFEALADYDTTYDVKNGITRTKNIFLKEIIDDGISSY